MVVSLDLERSPRQDEATFSSFAVYPGKHHCAAPSVGTEMNGGIAASTTPTPSTWKEKELLIKIDGEIKARNPNLEVLTNKTCLGAHTARGLHKQQCTAPAELEVHDTSMLPKHLLEGLYMN